MKNIYKNFIITVTLSLLSITVFAAGMNGIVLPQSKNTAPAKLSPTADSSNPTSANQSTQADPGLTAPILTFNGLTEAVNIDPAQMRTWTWAVNTQVGSRVVPVSYSGKQVVSECENPANNGTSSWAPWSVANAKGASSKWGPNDGSDSAKQHGSNVNIPGAEARSGCLLIASYTVKDSNGKTATATAVVKFMSKNIAKQVALTGDPQIDGFLQQFNIYETCAAQIRAKDKNIRLAIESSPALESHIDCNLVNDYKYKGMSAPPVANPVLDPLCKELVSNGNSYQDCTSHAVAMVELMASYYPNRAKLVVNPEDINFQKNFSWIVAKKSTCQGVSAGNIPNKAYSCPAIDKTNFCTSAKRVVGFSSVTCKVPIKYYDNPKCSGAEFDMATRKARVGPNMNPLNMATNFSSMQSGVIPSVSLAGINVDDGTRMDLKECHLHAKNGMYYNTFGSWQWDCYCNYITDDGMAPLP